MPIPKPIVEAAEAIAETAAHRARLTGKALSGEKMTNVEKLDLIHGGGVGSTLSQHLKNGVEKAMDWTVGLTNGSKSGRVK